ncbi:MAG: hypothetical protein Q7U39_00915 [Nitrospira sp.]|nr:hypothetical protein [Nitrospira sp.]
MLRNTQATRGRDRAQQEVGVHLIVLFVLGCGLAACNHISLDPAPVVPTAQPLPYSARVELTEVGAYLVQPGATMIADPRLQNHVTGKLPSVDRAKPQWEQAVLEYLAARKTFRQVVTEGPADLSMTLRVLIYVDPGVSFKFNHVYVATIEGALRDPRNGRALIEYAGKGKAIGEVSRGGTDDDRDPINRAVRAALNDLFEKLERDKRLEHL